MSSAMFFVQGCPTCGRRLQIRVEHLGKKVVCQHCRCQFTACDPASGRPSECDDPLIRRVDELLRAAPQHVHNPRISHPR